MKQTTKILSIIIVINIIMSLAISIFSTQSYAIIQTTSTDIKGLDEKKYPGIKSMIQELQKAHPNWNFKLLYTGLDWEDVIKGEKTHGKNLVQNQGKYYGKWICEKCGTTKTYSGGNWLCASEDAIKYMMDPRNSLYYADVFQFLELSYDKNANYDKVPIKKILENTFLDDGNLDSYITAIMDSCKKHNVNPYYLSVKIIQEQGKKGGITFKMADSISSEKISLDEEKKVLITKPETKVKDVLEFLEDTYTIKDEANKSLKDEDNVKTGCKVGDNKYEIVVLGDVNGDGQVKATDYMRIKNYIMGDTKLNENQKLAADVNLDGQVKATDYMKIKNYIMGDSEILAPGTTYYYNLFNINATGSTTADILKNALSKAKDKGWTSIEKCIDGGAEFIANGYISVGQDTMYFEKFNVVKTTYYSHQYAQDVLYAQNQGVSLRKVLESINATEYSYTFVIPVYENMPSNACVRPLTN